MNKANLLINSSDRKGNSLSINVEGSDTKELSHYGGLDLHVNAVKAMISNTNGMSFAEQEGDYLIEDKVIGLYLNEIGNFIRSLSIDPDFLSDISNLDLVKQYISSLEEKDEVMELIKRDSFLMKKEEEEML